MNDFDAGYDSFSRGDSRPPFYGDFQRGWDAAEQDSLDDQEVAAQIYINGDRYETLL